MISLNNISKTFKTKNGDVTAVQPTTLEISAGDVFGIIGHSGAGKSTLIRCINLLEKPTTGNVVINDTDLTTLSTQKLIEFRRSMGMIFQHFYLMPSRTVLQNVLLPLKNTKLSKAVKEQKAKDLIELVGLSHRITAYPSELSGGEKQRVAIARALANDPIVLLCDEATSALDPKTTKAILELLKEVNEQLGITIVLITHEMQVIKEICNKVAVMEGGIIHESGDVFDVFASPQTPVAQAFVSSTNNIEKIHDLIENEPPMVNLQPNERLIKLTFKTGNAQDAIISEVIQKYHVSANIILGNVEQIQGRLIGNLVLVLKGDEQQLAQTQSYFTQRGVIVEVISAKNMQGKSDKERVVCTQTKPVNDADEGGMN